MLESRENINSLTDHFFRHNYSKMVAILVRYFGLHQVEVAEDIVQDTLLLATEQWSIKGIPNNPEGWLMDVAKKKTINYLKRNQLLQNRIIPQLKRDQVEIQDVFENEGFIDDSTLEMIFCVCHPTLPSESQVALALKTLCGFSISEIARALLTTESNINKRLYRARSKFRDGSITIEPPDADRVESRKDVVYKTIYLLFNEGYYSVGQNTALRIDMCFEAIRLVKIMLRWYQDDGKAKALLSLMLLTIARFESRLDNGGALVNLQEQDRSKWDKDIIAEGMYYLQESIGCGSVNAYQLQAGIAVEHCLAKDFESTNWESIYRQYQILSEMDSSGVVLLNMAIAQFFYGERHEAISNLHSLREKSELKTYSMYYQTLGDMYKNLERYHSARSFYSKAIEYSHSPHEREQIMRKIRQ